MKIHRVVLWYIAGWYLIWHVLVLVFVYAQEPAPVQHNCPNLRIVHGVGSDLRTYMNVYDTCSELYADYLERR